MVQIHSRKPEMPLWKNSIWLRVPDINWFIRKIRWKVGLWRQSCWKSAVLIG